MSMRGMDLLTLQELSKRDLERVFELTKELRARVVVGDPPPVLSGKSVAMIFQRPSTRTRISFEVAIRQLGGHPIYLSWGELQLARGEAVEDTARVLSRYVDAVVARVSLHSHLEKLAEEASVPVINALSDRFHPCQVIADLFTMLEHKGYLEGLKVAYVGDGTNVCNTLLVGCTKMGIDISVACPKGYDPDSQAIEWARENAEETGAVVEILRDPAKAVEGADVVYTDTFVSMGLEAEREKRLKVFLPKYQVNLELMSKANPDAIFMHCLPAHRGEEVTDEVIDGPMSVVFDQAENRLHTQRALLALII